MRHKEVATIGLSLVAVTASAELRTDTWLTPPPSAQIYAEGLDDREGLGRIFVPAMTSPAREPLYAVFQGDDLVGEQSMGSSFFVLPGRYTVVLGSGSLEQRMRREVGVRRGTTTILEPDWCALTVEVIDELRSYFRQDMQIFRVEGAESYGLIPAIDPELGEQLPTLILPPGLYKIVKRGEDFNTFVNFVTVTLVPGTYTPLTVVMDAEEGKFVGAGVLASTTQLLERRAWRLYGAIHGSVLLNSANTATSRKVNNNFSFLGQFDNQNVYDRPPHYYLGRNLVEVGALRQEGAEFSISQDRLQSKNTYVYYVLNWLGGYGRLELRTHAFKTDLEFDRPRDVVLRELDGREERRMGITRLTTQPPLFPLELKEGAGVNLTPLRSFIARLSLRAGLGYWQIYNREVYAQDAHYDTLFIRRADNFPQGLETSLLSSLALLRNLTVTTELDVLFPFDQRESNVVDLENFTTLRLTKTVTLEHTFRLRKDPAVPYSIWEQFVSLRLSYFLF